MDEQMGHSQHEGANSESRRDPRQSAYDFTPFVQDGNQQNQPGHWHHDQGIGWPDREDQSGTPCRRGALPTG